MRRSLKFGLNIKFNREYAVFFFLFLFIIVSIFIKNEFVLHLLVLSFLYASLGSAWNIVGGMAGQFSLGHAAFLGIGAYSSAFLYLKYGLTPWIGMIIGGVISVFVGILVFYPSFRLREFYFVIATIAFLELIRSIIVYWRISEGGIDTYIPFVPSLKNMIFEAKNSYAILMVLFLIAVIIIEILIKNSKMGYYIRAIGENSDAAEMVGVSSSRYKLYALIISAFITAIAGTFFAQYFLFVSPTMVFSFPLSVQIALFAIMGGIGTVEGPIIGAIILTILDTYFRAWIGGSYGAVGSLIYGFMLMIFVIFLPGGILSWIEPKFKYLFKKLPGPVDEMLIERESFVLPKELTKSERKNEIILEVKSLKKNFGGLTAVNSLNFKVHKGEILGLIGPNGSGKTTTFNLLSGFLKPSEGKILFENEEISTINSPNRICKKGIGRTFQLVKPFGGMTVFENVMVGALLKRGISEAKNYSAYIIKLVGLWDFRYEYARALPLPFLKRLEIAKGLSTSPKLLLLDECMAGLNATEKKELMDVLRNIKEKLGITLMIIEHDMKSIMSLSDRIIVLNYGSKIAEGKPEEISRNAAVISAYLGLESEKNAKNS